MAIFSWSQIKKKQRETLYDFWRRCFCYLIIILLFYFWAIHKQGNQQTFPLTVSDLWHTAQVSFVFVFPSLVFVYLLVFLLSTLGVIISLYWGDLGKSIFQLPVRVFSLVGAIPTYLTAKFLSMWFIGNEKIGAYIALVFGSSLLVFFYGRFFSEFLDETHADHNRASLVMGCFPWVNFRRKFFTFLIDTGRPAFIFLLGLSLFVEVINNKPGEGFKGLAYLLWNCLNGQETWFGAWQVTVVIVGVIFMWDLLFSLSKLYVDRRLLS